MNELVTRNSFFVSFSYDFSKSPFGRVKRKWDVEEWKEDYKREMKMKNYRRR